MQVQFLSHPLMNKEFEEVFIAIQNSFRELEMKWLLNGLNEAEADLRSAINNITWLDKVKIFFKMNSIKQRVVKSAFKTFARRIQEVSSHVEHGKYSKEQKVRMKEALNKAEEYWNKTKLDLFGNKSQHGCMKECDVVA